MWFERETGLTIEDAGSAFTCPILPWRRALVDGIVLGTGAVWEAKHTSAFAKPDEVLARYMPQLQHNMAVVGAENSVLSVIYGNHRWETYEVAADWLYQDALLAAERAFWNSVLVGIPPVAVVPPPPPKPDRVREINFEGNNGWAVAAWDWLDTVDASKRHSAATNAIKGMLEDDVTRGFGHGIEAKRSKSGAVTIRKCRGMKPPRIYSAMVAVSRDLAKAGVAKSQQNQDDGYAFRGIDDVMYAVAPLLHKRRICVLPRLTERTFSQDLGGQPRRRARCL